MKAIPVVEVEVLSDDADELPYCLAVYGVHPSEFHKHFMVRVDEVFRRRGWTDQGYTASPFAIRERRYVKS